MVFCFLLMSVSEFTLRKVREISNYYRHINWCYLLILVDDGWLNTPFDVWRVSERYSFGIKNAVI